MAGTLLLRGSIFAPAGIIASVLMLSPTLINTSPFSTDSIGGRSGRGRILGPLETSIFSACSAGTGGIMPESSITNLSGHVIFGYSPRSRGSVILPVTAHATHTSGEVKYTLSSFVPLLPGQFLLNDRIEIQSLPGAEPIPIHPWQPLSRRRAPEAMILYIDPSRATVSNTCLEPGLIA